MPARLGITDARSMAKKKKRAIISTSEAVARIDKMIPVLYENIRSAIYIEATLEEGNRIVGDLEDRSFPGAIAFNRLMRSLSHDLALHLSRLYDRGSLKFPANKRDVVSIPLLARLLRQKRCQRILRKRAREWLPGIPNLAGQFEKDCESAVNRSLESYRQTFRGQHGRGGIRVLKEFRDNFLAHSLLTDSEANPRYHHLFRLVDSAPDFIEDARLAVTGINSSLPDTEEVASSEARKFWEKALLGTPSAERNWPTPPENS